MLELFFQGLERGVGPSLSHLATTVYWGSLLVLILSCVIPLYRLWRDYYAERVGLVRRWVITCKHCQKPTYVTGAHCAYCDADLRIPWTLRSTIPFWSERHGRLARRLWRAIRFGAILVFLVATTVVVIGTDVVGTEGSVPKLFIGVSLLAWTAFGRFAARTFRLDGTGLTGRVTDSVMAGVALLVCLSAAFVADAARAQTDSPLMRLTASGNAVQIGERQAVAISSGQARFDYLQLDHKALGYRRIIPLMFQGDAGVPLLENDIQRWLAERLSTYADGRSRRGLLIRLRTEHLRLAPGESYDLVLRDGQVVLQRLSTT